MRTQYFSIIILLSFVLVSCSKETETTQHFAGDLVSNPVYVMTTTKLNLQLIITIAAPVYLDSVKLDYDVDLYRVNYYTTNASKNVVNASGLIIIPKTTGSKTLPLVSFQHGTVLKKDEVPSNLQSGYEIAMIFASHGYVAVCPDYLGLGNSEKLHPYMHAATEASSVIDLLKATRTFCKQKGTQLNNQVFLMGYSQGGHATMSAFRELEKNYSGEFTVTAAAPMAGAYDMSNTQLNYMLSDSSYPSPAYLPYLLFGLNPIYHLFTKPSEIFISPYDSLFPPYFGDNPKYDFGVVNDLWPEGNRILSVLKPEVIEELKNNPNYSIKLALQDNDVYEWVPQAPVMLCHCDMDTQVPYQNSVIAYNYFTQHGATHVFLLNPLPGGNHSNCSLPSLMAALRWFNTLKN